MTKAKTTDYRVRFAGSHGWIFCKSEAGAKSFAGIRTAREVQRIEPDGNWKTIHMGNDPKPNKEDGK